MSEYLVEVYTPRTGAGITAPGAEQATLAAEQLTREGIRVRFLHSIFVPDEEICFYLFQAPTVETVRAAAVRAGLCFERITEVESDWTANNNSQVRRN